MKKLKCALLRICSKIVSKHSQISMPETKFTYLLSMETASGNYCIWGGVGSI